ncbi:MAG: hypothetical protein EA359_01995 [Balneolaceae bacterium]|nr:MAG: hypothetical protein EA359_01995 [Balneolaceae bacterium]
MKWNETSIKNYKIVEKLTFVISQRFDTIKYHAWYFFKSLSLKSEKKKFKMFQTKAQKSELFFTTNLVQSGFTDQLFGFKLLYEIGTSLGLEYTYTPLESIRSSIPFSEFGEKESTSTSEKKDINHEKPDSIFNFLGINQSLAQLSKPLQGDEVYNADINLDLLVKNDGSIKTFDQLLKTVNQALLPFIYRNRPTVYCFRASARFYFPFNKLIPKTTESIIDYQKFFQNKLDSTNFKNKNDSCKFNIFLHIRQGDTAVIQTPWNTYIPVWYKFKDKYKQLTRSDELNEAGFISIQDFYSFYITLLENLDANQFATHVYSDGFKKAFLLIYKYSKRKDITQKEINRLKSVQVNYDTDQFSVFRKIPNTKMVIGEELSKMYEYIHDFMKADILITGTQQIMIPKLVASYFHEDEMPLLIILYRNKSLDIDYLGLNEVQGNIIQVNIENYDEIYISNKIRDHLTKKTIKNNSNRLFRYE